MKLSTITLFTLPLLPFALAGGFADSCRHIRIEGDKLIASCRNATGIYGYQILDFGNCLGYEGSVTIIKKENGGFNGNCRSCTLFATEKGAYMHCVCRRRKVRDGSWESVDAFNLGGVVSNQNGVMACDGAVSTAYECLP